MYKEISDHHDLQNMNATVCQILSLYNEKTKIQTLGSRKCFVFKPATGEEGIIQFRIVNENLTPLIGLSDSETLKLIELLQENIATSDSDKPNVPSYALELHTPLTMETILSKYPDVFDDSVGKLEGELHLSFARNKILLHRKQLPGRSLCLSKTNLLLKSKIFKKKALLKKELSPLTG